MKIRFSKTGPRQLSVVVDSAAALRMVTEILQALGGSEVTDDKGSPRKARTTPSNSERVAGKKTATAKPTKRTAKKAAPARKSVTPKTVAKKAAAKKSVTPKTVAKKAAAKKSVTRKRAAESAYDIYRPGGDDLGPMRKKP